jgi:hypothetical protein
MGFTLPTAPTPADCGTCNVQALRGWEGHMSWPDLVYVYCPKCGKRGPTVSNPGRRKWPVQAETRASDLWNEMQERDRAAAASAAFNSHVKGCANCEEPFGYCGEGMRLMRASVDAGNV